MGNHLNYVYSEVMKLFTVHLAPLLLQTMEKHLKRLESCSVLFNAYKQQHPSVGRLPNLKH